VLAHHLDALEAGYRAHYDEVRDYDRVVQRIHRTLDELTTLPGVAAAATSAWLPGVGDWNPAEFDLVEGRAASEQNRLRTIVISVFAVTALSLACLGVWGTLSYLVTLRRREIGLRLFLGAPRVGILSHFLGQAVRVAVIACACGLALSAVFARVLSSMLYGVSASDPAPLSSVVAIVLGVAVLAALVPAARAALAEPMRILREE
jgi:ABC-type antimicrobial peptide transport system permease subunit